MKKILMFLVISILLINLASAFTFDNIKKIEEKGEYGKITIKNFFGFGATLWDGELTSNTDNCGESCSAEQTIVLPKDGVLIEDIRFEINQPYSYQTYIKTNIKVKEIDDYGFQCNPTGEYHLNGSEKVNCNKIKTGIHNEYTYDLIPYNIGDEVDAGIYNIIIKGSKNPMKEVDWIIKTRGKWLNEWALWGTDSESVSIGSYFDQTAGSYNGLGGWSITINNSLNFTVTGFESSLGSNIQTNGYICHDYNCTSIIAQTTSVNNYHNFSSPVTLNASQTYWILVNGSYVRRTEVHTPSLMPVSTSNFVINASRNPHDNSVITGDVLGFDLIAVWGYSNNSYVTLNTPANETVALFSVQSITFNCSVTTVGANVTNISLYTNESGVWEAKNITTGLIGTTNNSQWGRDITNGDFVWNCYACDLEGNCGFATINRTLVRNTTVVSLVTFESSLNNNLSDYWTFDEGTGIHVNNSVNGSHNGTLLSATWNSTADCLIGNCSYAGNSQSINFTNIPSLHGVLTEYTINLWFNRSTGSSTARILGYNNEIALSGFNEIYIFDNPLTYNIGSSGAVAEQIPTSQTYPNDKWVMMTLVKNKTHIDLYLNGTLKYTGTQNGSDFGADYWLLLNWKDGANNQAIKYDEFGIWNRNLSATEISTLYNSGAGLSYPFSGSITLDSPADNTHSSNATITFSATASIGDLNLTNMSLWHNSTGTWHRNKTEVKMGAINTSTLNITFPEGNFIWNYEACITNGSCGYASASRNLRIDTTPPAVLINRPLNITYPAPLGIWITVIDNMDSSTTPRCIFTFDNYTTNYTTFPSTLDIYRVNNNFSITDGSYLVNVWCNDSSGNINNTEKQWFTYSSSVTLDSETYANKTYSPTKEIFTLTLNYNQSIYTTHEAKLNYAFDSVGTNYTATRTVSGSLSTFSVDLPIPDRDYNLTHRYQTNAFYWTVNLTSVYGGHSFYNTTTKNQTVYPSIFGLCNSTFVNDTYLNLSFKDENTGSVINGTITSMTVNYWINNNSNYKTYTFGNASKIETNYTFCFSGSAPSTGISNNVSVHYSLTGYPQRIWSSTINMTNSSFNKTLLLLPTASGSYTTIQVVNSADQILQGVYINVTRSIGGVDVVIGSGTTGAAGTVTFWLDPNYNHDFTLIKAGYTTFETSFFPTQSSYTINMGGGGVVDQISYRCIDGMNYYLTPVNISLTNDTEYSFGFKLISDYWDIGQYGFSLRLKNGTIITGGTSTISGTQLSKTYNTTNQTAIYLDYYWIVTDECSHNGTFKWIVYNTGNTQWSINNFVTDLKAYMNAGIFGLDNFGRYLIIFLIMFVTIGILSYKFGFTSPLVVLTVVFLITFMFDVVLGLIPTIAVLGGIAVPHLLTFITAAMLAIVIIKEVST